MRTKLFVAALAVLGGCDHHHGIGAVGPDAGGVTSGEEAGAAAGGSGAGGAVGSSGMLQVAGGSGGCGSFCLVPVGGSGGDTAVSPNPKNCGNGVIDIGEYCDDGNTAIWDGCTGCIVEAGWQCPAPGKPCIPIPIYCGNGMVDPGEQCDDGNTISGDGCNALCQFDAPSVDAGTTQPRSDAGVPVLPVHDAGPAATGPLSQGPTSWTGYIENYQFPSGSDVIKFTSTVDSAGQVKVTVFLGNGTPPPPATDPKVGYPPALRTLAMNGMMPPDNDYWAEGFAYSVASGTFSGQRLRFTIKNSQLWSGWCALQKPVDNSGMCLPESWPARGCDESHQCSMMNYATGQVIQVDLAAFNLCLSYRVCACSTTACDSDPSSGIAASFDLAVIGPAADGSVVGLISERANVHFTLDPL